MSIKLGSIVMMLMMVFIAKISYETAMTENTEVAMLNDRAPASIDRSYQEHLNKH
jgi:hypothetical protein